MKSLVSAAIPSRAGSPASHQLLVRLLGLAPAALLLSGLFAVWAVPLAVSVAAAAPTDVVVAWGDNYNGQTTVPAGLSGVTAISAGGYHSLALKSNGTLVAWGYNGDGQTTVPAGLSGVTAISAGYYHSLALKADGTVVAWGYNGYGQTYIPAGLSSVTAIAAGEYHSLALRSDHTVAAWGYNGDGQTNVPAGLSDVKAIAAGGFHSLALKSDGTVVAWGDDTCGQTNVPAGLSGVTAIAAGGFHSLALKSDGTVVAWGDDNRGETRIPAGLLGVTAIAAGSQSSLALRSNGTLVAWGDDTYGQTNVPAGLSGVTAITAGGFHGLALEPSVAATLTVSGIPSSCVAGVAHSVTATAKDPSGNTATGYRGTIHFASPDPAAVLPADYTFTAADAGTRVFSGSVTLKTAGTQSVSATDTVASSITGVQAGIVVTPAVASTLVVSGIPNSYVAGVAHSVTVTAKDSSGNTATGYQGTAHFTSSDPTAVLPADYTFTVADAGTHVFGGSVTLKTAGTQSVSATDTVTGTITGVQAGIVVTPATVKTLVVSGIPNPTAAGVAGNVTVTATDAYGNRVSSYLGTVHFTSTDAKAGLPANYTFTAADNGVHTFTVILKTEGTQSVTATDTKTATIKGAQAGIVVNPAAAVTLVVSGLTTPRTAGSWGSIRVTATDAYGNRIHGYLGTVQFTSSDPQAKLPADYTFTVADAGTHVFSGNVIPKTAGTQSVTATDTVTSTVTGAQAGIVVNAAALSKLVVSGLSSPRTAGTTGSIRVTATDAYGNRIHTYLGTVHFTSSDPQAKLPANYTFTAADAGTHVFSGNVILKTAGTKSVTATDTVTSTIKGAHAGIVVNAAALSKLVVSGLTTPRTAGSWGNIRVTATDAYGNRIHGYRGTVHFTSSDARAKLPANYKFTAADAGTHVFSGAVILKTAGTQSVSATDTLTKTIKGSQTSIVVKS